MCLYRTILDHHTRHLGDEVLGRGVRIDPERVGIVNRRIAFEYDTLLRRFDDRFTEPDGFPLECQVPSETGTLCTTRCWSSEWYPTNETRRRYSPAGSESRNAPSVSTARPVCVLSGVRCVAITLAPGRGARSVASTTVPVTATWANAGNAVNTRTNRAPRVDRVMRMVERLILLHRDWLIYRHLPPCRRSVALVARIA